MYFFPYSNWHSQEGVSLSSLTGGPIAYYNFANIVSSPPNFGFVDLVNKRNLSGNSDNALITPGKMGLILKHPFFQDLAFNCTGGNYVTYDDSTTKVFAITGDKTFTFWISGNPNSGSSQADMIFSEGSGNGSTLVNFSYFAYRTFLPITQQNIRFQIITSVNTTINIVIPFSNQNSWNFVACWLNYSTKSIFCQINANGTLASGNYIGSDLKTGTYLFNIGNASTIKPLINGIYTIDEFAVFNRLLTSGEFKYLYNNGVGRTYPFN